MSRERQASRRELPHRQRATMAFNGAAKVGGDGGHRNSFSTTPHVRAFHAEPFLDAAEDHGCSIAPWRGAPILARALTLDPGPLLLREFKSSADAGAVRHGQAQDAVPPHSQQIPPRAAVADNLYLIRAPADRKRAKRAVTLGKQRQDQLHARMVPEGSSRSRHQ